MVASLGAASRHGAARFAPDFERPASRASPATAPWALPSCPGSPGLGVGAASPQKLRAGRPLKAAISFCSSAPCRRRPMFQGLGFPQVPRVATGELTLPSPPPHMELRPWASPPSRAGSLLPAFTLCRAPLSPVTTEKCSGCHHVQQSPKCYVGARRSQLQVRLRALR